MADYYINANNTTGGVPPYSSVGNGAPNFYTLLNAISGSINDGDNIKFQSTPSVVVNDSAHTIEIQYKLNIIGDLFTKVRLPDSGIGMNILKDGATIKNLNVYSDVYHNNNLIYTSANNVSISNSIFGLSGTTPIQNGNCSMITAYKSDGLLIDNNIFYCPDSLNSDPSYGVYVDSSNFCIIKNNVINMQYNNGKAISVVGYSDFTDISYNIMGKFDSSTAGNSGILFGNLSNYSKIHHNVIGISGPGSVGITHGIDNDHGIGIEINNNCILIRENDSSTVGLFIPYKQDNDVADFTIINNIFDFRGGINDSIALQADIKQSKSIINFNNIYGFKPENIFFTNGAPDIITKMGKKTITVDSKLVEIEDPTAYTAYDIRRYYCNSNSQCIGAGYLNHNIGVGVDTDMKVKSDNYVNIIDTVTSNFGVMAGKENTICTFFNSVFTDTETSFDNGYRVGKGPYMYEDTTPLSATVYNNQFNFKLTIPTEFPFTTGDKIFYNKDIENVNIHRKDLQPFSGIVCYPNPGYNAPEYKYYEYGLWGYPRAAYQNECGDGCIIQDTIKDVIKRQDTTNNSIIHIEDSIIPPCSIV